MVNLNGYSKKENKELMIDYLFYLTAILLSASVFATLMLNFKVDLQNRRLQDIEAKSMTLGTGERQALNTKVLNYKRKVDDFAQLIKSHKINSNVFSFIEEKTVPNVWFATFLMQGEDNEIKLTGEASTMQALSSQIQAFEGSTEEVTNVSVVDSQVNPDNRITFTLNLTLRSSVFSYKSGTSSSIKPATP